MKFKKKKYNAENINFENDYISLENAKQVGIIHLVKTLDQRHLLVAEIGVDKKQYHELLDLKNRSMIEIEILNFSAAKLGEWYKISTEKRKKKFMTCPEELKIVKKKLNLTEKKVEDLTEKYEKLTQELNELKKNNSNTSPNEGNGFEF